MVFAVEMAMWTNDDFLISSSNCLALCQPEFSNNILAA
jgi:hypothetical protein